MTDGIKKGEAAVMATGKDVDNWLDRYLGASITMDYWLKVVFIDDKLIDQKVFDQIVEEMLFLQRCKLYTKEENLHLVMKFKERTVFSEDVDYE